MIRHSLAGRWLAVLRGLRPCWIPGFAFLFVAVATSFVLGQGSPFALIRPGPALAVDPMVVIGAERTFSKGAFYLTTVYEDEATIEQWLWAWAIKEGIIVPRENLFPSGVSREQQNEAMQQMLDESRTVAVITALREAGYDVPFVGQGARVEEVVPASPAVGKLQPSEVIVGAEGQPVEQADDLIRIVRRKRPGEGVTLQVVDERQERRDVRIVSGQSPEEYGRAFIGIAISTYQPSYRLPFPVDVEAEGIGGPSAGLMFALGVLDALLDEDLTSGLKIAGTGYLSLDGSVGPVGAITEKVRSAQSVGADYFLVPQENYEEVAGLGGSMPIVGVESLSQAHQFLSNLAPVPVSLQDQGR